MPKKKDIKPLMSVKHDFVDSLDNFTQQVIMLLQVTRTLCDPSHKNISMPDGIRSMLKERHDAVEAAFMTTNEAA